MPRGRIDVRRGREERYSESQRYWDNWVEEERAEGRRKQDLEGRKRLG